MKLRLTKTFGQRESVWKDKKLGTSTVSIIGKEGCLLSNIAAVCCYHGKDIDPARLNDELVKKNGFYQANRLIYGVITDIFPDIVVDWSRYIDCADVPAPLDVIYQTLNEGLIPLLKVDASPVAGVQEHWVKGIGYDNITKELLVFDPYDKAEYWFIAKYGDPISKILKIVVYRGNVPENTNAPSTPITPPQNTDLELHQKVDELSLRVAEAEISQTQTKDEVNKIVPRLDSIAHDISDLNKDRAILETIQGNMAGIEEKVKLNSETVKSSETNLKAEIRGLQASTSDEIESIKVRVKILEEKPASDTGITIIRKIGKFFIGKYK